MNSKLTDPATLKRAFPVVVAAYRDYQHYYCTLASLAEDFDESLETFDRTTWYNMILQRENTDDYAMDCIASLDNASSAFGEIAEEAERGFIIVLKATLALPPEKQLAVFDRAFKIEPQVLDQAIDEMFLAFDEVNYQYNVEKNYEDFLQLIDRVWVDYRVAV